jgi:predicted amidohydrolase YtcJ
MIAIRTSLLVLLSALTALSQAPDVIYYNASVITMSAGPIGQPIGQSTAQAVAIRGDRFAAVGSNAEVLKLAGPATQKIDLGGKCMVPGIIETHVHPIGAALSEIDGPVPVVHSIAELKDYIQTQDKKLPPGRLIFIPKVYSTRLADHRYPRSGRR